MAYQPPRQSGAGQVIDSLLILVLLFVCLLLPFELKKMRAAEQATAPASTGQAAVPNPDPTWESLGQNTVMAQQWEKLGKKPADAKGLIESKFDFAADLRSHWLWITAIVIVGYFLLLLRLSDREYREVIAERFGESN